MIRAYDEALFETAVKDQSLEDFIAETTLAAEPAGVRAELARFLIERNPVQRVGRFLVRLMDDEALLAKTQLVTDRNWRNCVMLVTPKRVAITQGGITFADGSSDLNATLSYWRRHADTIFIHLNEQGGEAPERTLGESMEYLLLWLFKRYFGKVAS